jgi:hypothetical protein
MTERQSFEIEQTKDRIFNRDRWQCVICGKKPTQLAHGISNSKMNIKKYGKEIVHHDYNLFSVCGLACNSKCNIDNKPNEVKEILTKIQNYWRLKIETKKND